MFHVLNLHPLDTQVNNLDYMFRNTKTIVKVYKACFIKEIRDSVH